MNTTTRKVIRKGPMKAPKTSLSIFLMRCFRAFPSPCGLEIGVTRLVAQSSQVFLKNNAKVENEIFVVKKSATHNFPEVFDEAVPKGMQFFVIIKIGVVKDSQIGGLR